jgi:hypothetical protein
VNTLDSVGTNTESVYRNIEFAVVSITLGASTDTVLVLVGTNNPDSTVAQQEYAQVSVIDMANGDELTEITGNTTANRKYFIKWAYKQKHFQLKAPTGGNDNDIVYTIEWY